MDDPLLSEFAAGEPDNPRATDLPAFNQLQVTCSDCFAGRASLDDALAALDTVDVALGGTFHRFYEELPFHEDSAVQTEAASTLGAAFGPVQVGLLAARSALEAADEPAAAAALVALRLDVHRICAALADLRDSWNQRTPFSELPWADELLRVAHLYLSGRLPLARFQSRFEQFAAWHASLEEGLETLVPAPRERDTADRLAPRLAAALQSQASALAELSLFFVDLCEPRVAPSLDQIQAAAAELVAVQQAIQAAGEMPSTVPCVRCGAANEPAARCCCQCHAVLLRSVPDAHVPQVDIVDSEAPGAMAAAPPAVAENVARLEQAVMDAASGEAGEAMLSALLDELETTTTKAMAGLKRMPAPPSDMPAAQLEIYLRARAHLEQGGAGMLDGLVRVRQSLVDHDRGLLAEGLEAFRAGADEAMGVRALWEQVNETANPARNA